MSNRFTAHHLIQGIFDDIERLEEYAQKMIAKFVTDLTGDSYSEQERFIFELLQNADDLPTIIGQVHVKLVILENHLLVLHNGKPFDDENLRAICNRSESTKSKNSDQTGYKGIGFKSVFHDSQCVYINSGDFSFKFDRNSTKHQNPAQTPWQIKPIWVERDEYPDEIQAYSDFFESPVATALKVSPEKINDYKEKIKKLFSDPRLILFLRHISSIEVYGLNDLSLDIKVIKLKQQDIYTIQYTALPSEQTIETQWIIKNFELPVSQNIREAMKNDEKVPDKLKSIQNSKLTFAVEIVNNQIHPVDNSVLFNYLPTNVKADQFPFLINADFLTTAGRETIHVDHTWNCFLFEQIGYYIFEWIAHLAKQPEYKNFITAILPKKFKQSPTELEEKFNRGFDKAVEEVPFIPAEEVPDLLKVCEAVIDKTQICKLIPEKLILDFLNLSGHFVNYFLTGREKLEDLEKINTFDSKNLSNLIRNHQELRQKIKLEPEYNFALVEHIYKHYKQKLETDSFYNVSFLLSEQGELQSPQNLYFQVNHQEKQELSFTSLNFLHPFLNDKISEDPHFKNWAKQSLKIKNFSGLEFLSKRILNRQFKPDINPQSRTTLVAYIRFIFKYHTKLNQSEYLALNKLVLIHENFDGKCYINEAAKCHLSDFYNPDGIKFKSVAENIGGEYFKFLVEDYCGDSSQLYEWKKFFTSIGVKSLNAILILKENIIPRISNNKITDENLIPITLFVFKTWQSQSLSDLELKHLPLKTNNGLKPADQCHIIEEQSNLIREDSDNSAIKLQNVVDIGAYISSEDFAAFRQFLISILKVKVTTYIEFIRQTIKQISKNPQLVTAENTISVVREIFSYRNCLTDEELQNLKVLNLLLKDGKSVAKAENCYLSSDYQPTFNMEQIYASTGFSGFVSAQYCKHGNYTEWKKFFIRIKVMQEFNFTNEEWSLDTLLAALKDSSIHKPYKEYLEQQKSVEKKATHLQNYFGIKHIFGTDGYYLNIPEFARGVLTYISNQWDELNLNSKAFLVDKDSGTQREVDTLFEFLFKRISSIPCLDGICHPSANGIYSSNFKTIVEECFPVLSIKLNPNFEKFLGIKQEIDVADCLPILDDIRDKFSGDENNQKLRLQNLLKYLTRSVIQDGKEIDKNQIQDWIERGGQLLSDRDQFNEVRNLFYLDPELGIFPKNHSQLLQIPSFSEDRESIVKTVVDLFDIPLLNREKTQKKFINHQEDDKLKQLILERSIFIGIFLEGSRSPEIEEHIQNQVQETKFYNPQKILLSFDEIDYQASIPNYWDNETRSLYYIRQWNNINNDKFGDLILKVLQLDKEIPSQVLLRLLDYNWKDAKEYLQENGCDVSDIREEDQREILAQTVSPLEIEQTEAKENELETTSSALTRSPDGTGENREAVGKWGEEQAKQFYERMGYKPEKINDFSKAGYDFKCFSWQNNPQKLWVEVKTISSNTPIIRLKPSQWEKMQTPKKRQLINPHTHIVEPSFEYQLLIVAHTNCSPDQIIQISDPWEVLKLFVSRLYDEEVQNKTEAKYKKLVEVIVGFQQSEKGETNEILLNWHRLLEQAKIDERIKIHPRGNLNV
ncbi:ATP-binding protein [Oscillatoria acuminata]|uniref:Sacsin/Nov domain-containing protein n=1 Tax=Oscillatoria acuminata PCC 6304 TaxID=56110 RepID=K9TJH3_9CYAN|nr:ATP-binding protein [Oscillatoria acuminata]AFY83002.1 hypothetical protein Oscil6304_3433 [Oscillatoria acuminata PCC 6304]